MSAAASPEPRRAAAELASLLAKRGAVDATGVTVAAYTFPGFHASALNEKLFAPGWSEYALMRGCTPWFPGHEQPRQPLLGALDERLPSTWEIYNRLAREHGVDAFIWDAYWYDDGPAFHEALEEGFLRAPNVATMQFAVMWTNHHWPVWFPNVDTAGRALIEYRLRSPDHAEETAWRSLTHMVGRYCHLPNYWRIEDCPVLVIWSPASLVQSLGEPRAAKLLKNLRRYAQQCGHRDLHLHAPQPDPELLARLGLDSGGEFNPVHVRARALKSPKRHDISYAEVALSLVKDWLKAARGKARASLPMFPSASPGWDTAPRRIPYRVDGKGPEKVWAPAEVVVTGDTPALFKALVQGALAVLQSPGYRGPRVLTIGSWNEWTEGQYLLPDTRYGYGILRALAEALGRRVVSAPILERYVGTHPLGEKDGGRRDPAAPLDRT